MGRDGLTTYHATWGVCGVREGFELGVGGERLRQLLVVKTIFLYFFLSELYSLGEEGGDYMQESAWSFRDSVNEGV